MPKISGAARGTMGRHGVPKNGSPRREPWVSSCKTHSLLGAIEERAWPTPYTNLLVHVIFSTKDPRAATGRELKHVYFPTWVALFTSLVYRFAHQRRQRPRSHAFNCYRQGHVSESPAKEKENSSGWVHREFSGQKDVRVAEAIRHTVSPFAKTIGVGLHRESGRASPQAFIQRRMIVLRKKLNTTSDIFSNEVALHIFSAAPDGAWFVFGPLDHDLPVGYRLPAATRLTNDPGLRKICG